jgi:hypothetical protein
VTEALVGIFGAWSITSSPDFDDRYLNEDGPAFVVLRQEGNRVAGEYRLGLQAGTLDGRLRPDGSALFSFDGTDESEEVWGAGTAAVEGDRLAFTLMYHLGDDYTFEGRPRR